MPHIDPDNPRNAVLVECGQHWEQSSNMVAIEVTLRFLAHFDLLDRAFVKNRLPAEPPPSQRQRPQ